MTSGTANAYAYGGAAGYREEGIAPAGLSTAYALEKVGARYYDQAFGAFLTRDTDLSQKPYAYCDGDPVNFSDPTGHDTALPVTAETTAHNDLSEGMDDIQSGAGDDFGNEPINLASTTPNNNNSNGTGTVTASTTQQGPITTDSLGITINLGRTTLTDTATATIGPIHTSFGDVAGVSYNFGGGTSMSDTYTSPTGGKPASNTLKVTYTFKF